MLLPAVLSAVLLVQGTALAQDDAAYQTAIASALGEFERGNYDEALVLFREAHRLEPSARTLRGLGNVTFELRRYVEAVEFFDAALASEFRPLTEEMRAEVMELLSRARAFVGHLSIALTPEDAVVLVDGVAATADSVLTVGEHDVVVSLDGYTSFSSRVTIDGGETEQLRVVLLPVGGAPTGESAGRAVTLTADEPVGRAMMPAGDDDAGGGVMPRASGGSVAEEWWFWTIIGTVVVGGAVGIGVGVSSSGTSTEAPLVPTSGVVIMTLGGP